MSEHLQSLYYQIMHILFWKTRHSSTVNDISIVLRILWAVSIIFGIVQKKKIHQMRHHIIMFRQKCNWSSFVKWLKLFNIMQKILFMYFIQNTKFLYSSDIDSLYFILFIILLQSWIVDTYTKTADCFGGY